LFLFEILLNQCILTVQVLNVLSQNMILIERILSAKYWNLAFIRNQGINYTSSLVFICLYQILLGFMSHMQGSALRFLLVFNHSRSTTSKGHISWVSPSVSIVIHFMFALSLHVKVLVLVLRFHIWERRRRLDLILVVNLFYLFQNLLIIVCFGVHSLILVLN
jgi:hypothetical protein